MNNVERLKQGKLVAVIRGARAEQAVPIAKALVAGGIFSLELTADTPNVLDAIRDVKKELGEDVIVGAGTVLDPETARAAIMAGAEFIFSPTLNVETIKMTRRYGVISIPGAMTPTEILTAYEHGADLIKVFPADVFGVGYFKGVKGPLPHIPLMPTGGIDLTNIEEYFQAGAVAAGLGSALLNPKKLQSAADYDELTKTARAFADKAASFS